MARAAGGVVEGRSRADEIMRESPWQLAWRGVRDELFNISIEKQLSDWWGYGAAPAQSIRIFPSELLGIDYRL